MESMNYFLRVKVNNKICDYELFNGQLSRRDNNDYSYVAEYRIVGDIDKELISLIKYLIGMKAEFINFGAKKIEWE